MYPTKFYKVQVVITLLIGLYTHTANANEKKNCWVSVGVKYNIDPWLLYSIAQVESSLNPAAINYNKTSVDFGLMQVNSWWLPKLKKYGINKNSLYDSCINIDVGAWILSQSIKGFDNFWEGVGAYNAGTGKTKKAKLRRNKYAAKVYKQYTENIKTYNLALD